MRFLVGGLLLLGSFGLALAWQRDFTAAARAARDTARGREPPAASSPDLPAGWGRVIVGRPSGSAAVGSALSEEVAPATPAQPTAADRELQLVVERGQSLSEICTVHYGSARRDIVQALARYNALEDENQLRAGQMLRLPPLERLLAQPH